MKRIDWDLVGSALLIAFCLVMIFGAIFYGVTHPEPPVKDNNDGGSGYVWPTLTPGEEWYMNPANPLSPISPFRSGH